KSLLLPTQQLPNTLPMCQSSTASPLCLQPGRLNSAGAGALTQRVRHAPFKPNLEKHPIRFGNATSFPVHEMPLRVDRFGRSVSFTFRFEPFKVWLMKASGVAFSPLFISKNTSRLSCCVSVLAVCCAVTDTLAIQTSSSPITITSDDHFVWVVNPDNN